MPINTLSVKNALLKAGTIFPGTSADAARSFAESYLDCVSLVTAAGSTPVFLGGEVLGATQAFARALLSPSAGTPASYASAWVQAIDAFWLFSPSPVIFVGVSSGLVQPSVAGAGLYQTIFLVASRYPNVEEFSAVVASAVGNYTLSFQAFLTPPGALFPLL